jgi:O-antigen/teichoic acid export membrane protein
VSNTGQVIKNVSFNWVGMAVGLVLGFVQAPIVVNGLGNTWFGIWVLINQVVSYTWLFDLGIREAVVRYVARHHAREEYQEINEIVSSAIHVYLLISLLTIAITTVLTAILPSIFQLDQEVVGVTRLVLFFSGLNIAINWFFNAYIGILMGLQRFDIFQKIGLGTGIVSFVLIVSFIKVGYGVIALSVISLAMSLVSNAFVYWNCRRLLPEFRLVRYDRKKFRIRPLIDYGKYVLLNNVGGKIIYASDAVIIGIFLQVSSITFYAIAGTLINMLRNLVSSATWVMNPLFSQLEASNEMGRVKDIFMRATKLSLLLGLPVGIVYLFMGENFITLWIGKGYGEGSAWVLIILTVGTLFTTWEHIVGSVLFGTSRHHIIAWLRILEAGAKILLCVLFIKIWGIEGVALGAALSHLLFMGIILPVFVCREMNISINTYAQESILPPIVSSVPFAICCYFVNSQLLASNMLLFFSWIAALMPVFMVSAWYFAFDRYEREEYTNMIRRFVPCLRAFVRQRSR